jgi:hypothetical protein
MAQIFHPSFNMISRLSIFGAAFVMTGLGWFLIAIYRSYYITGAHIAHVQPVKFSHEHHAGRLGIDCRYCHTTVEDSAFAGVPPTKTCMNCHQEIWVGSDVLAPVRDSYRSNESIPWQRVHNLPEFVYFDHHVHVKKGVGCVECHGRVDRMPFTYQAESLLMEWCLDCHRDPAPHLRPRDQVFNMTWKPGDEKDSDGGPIGLRQFGNRLAQEYDVKSLTSCSTCHR